MPTVAKILDRRNLATAPPATLYTVPASTTTIVTNIAVTNTVNSDQTFSLLFNGVQIFSNNTVTANSTEYIDLKQVLTAGQTITGHMGGLGISIHISGVEIT